MSTKKIEEKPQTKKEESKKGSSSDWLAIFVFFMVAVAIFALFASVEDEPEVFSGTDFGVSTYTSKVDMNENGIDDQTEILMRTREYISTKPSYKSEYYNTGYPNDGYGVCTDVVGYALKNSGYDLMTLVNRDIIENPEDYDIETPDINIDFRRVKNLIVYFDHTAISLTTDINDISQWQGGDIIVWSDHIGIVSDNRNEKGMPYVIHHARPGQTRYEEDVFGKKYDEYVNVVRHFRIS